MPREQLDVVGKRMEERLVQLRDNVRQADALLRAGKMSSDKHLAVSRRYTAFAHQVDMVLEAMLRYLVTYGEE